MRYIYHYHAKCDFIEMDGIVDRNKEIDSYEEYKKFKNFLADEDKLNKDRFIIMSLTLLKVI